MLSKPVQFNCINSTTFCCILHQVSLNFYLVLLGVIPRHCAYGNKTPEESNTVHNSISVTHLPSFCERVLWHQVKGKWCMLEAIPCMPLTRLHLQLPDKSWFAAKQPVKEAENLASFFTCLSINTLSCNSQNSLHKLPIGNPSHALFLVIGIPKLISSIPCTYAR